MVYLYGLGVYCSQNYKTGQHFNYVRDHNLYYPKQSWMDIYFDTIYLNEKVLNRLSAYITKHPPKLSPNGFV